MKKEKKNNSLKIIGYILLFFMGLLIALNLIYRVELKINGENKLIVKKNESFVDAGVTLKVCQVWGCKLIASEKKTLDTSKAGKYELIYAFTYKHKKYVIKKQVEVVDNVAPELRLWGEFVVDNVNEEPGYQAIDDTDGDITAKVIKSQQANLIKYEVSDTAGNGTTAYRLLKNNNFANIIYLDGEKECLNYDKQNSNINCWLPGEYYKLEKVANGEEIARLVKIYNLAVDDPDLYWESIKIYLESLGYHMSLGYKNLITQKVYTYNENQNYYGASLIKTLAALYAFENLALNDQLLDWVQKTISLSDNQAYRNLVNYIGVNNLNNYAYQLGVNLKLNNNDYYGETNIWEQFSYMEYLNKFPSPLLKSYFINNHYNVVKLNEDVINLHKYGYYDKYFHESAIFETQEPYILIILSEEARNNYKDIFSKISELVYQLNQLETS